MGGGGVSQSQVSRLCEEIHGRGKAFLERPLEGDWSYIWIDTTYFRSVAADPWSQSWSRFVRQTAKVES